MAKEQPLKEETDFTYAQAYPGGWLHSPELGDKPVTVRIQRAVLREVKNHVTGKVDKVCVFVFANPKTGELLDREYIASKTNAYICAQAFGQHAKTWAGRLITIASVPCDFGPWGSRISFVGSPDIDHDMQMTTPGMRQHLFRKTRLNGPVAEPDADPDPQPDDADPVADEEPPEDSMFDEAEPAPSVDGKLL